jgi:hypothetical protein
MRNGQEEMPYTGEGVERKTIKPLEDAIDLWDGIKKKRMALTEKEIEAKAAVRVLMEKHGLEIYRYDEGHEVILASNVKVRKVDQEGSGSED